MTITFNIIIYTHITATGLAVYRLPRGHNSLAADRMHLSYFFTRSGFVTLRWRASGFRIVHLVEISILGEYTLFLFVFILSECLFLLLSRWNIYSVILPGPVKHSD